jgi:hypothetical protein
MELKFYFPKLQHAFFNQCLLVLLFDALSFVRKHYEEVFKYDIEIWLVLRRDRKMRQQVEVSALTSL